ncbi:MAG: hypothetical protein A4E57_04363 [Syntrophorhabdaceae bacterium PtaU1.Bin034]|nr:MAG: hypothetical protein A4E57_04363 [Syntrophorhabdaceae bacterium PtaU1.Bin034]
MGRPDDPRRQRCPGIDGVQDLRLRRRARGHLGTGKGCLLGLRERVAWRQALRRRQGSRKSPRRRSDGPDLCEPGGPERQPGPDRCSAGYPRDLRPHGDERRGDGGPHRGRPHLRQDPRRRRSLAAGPGAGSGTYRRSGPGLEERLRYRQRQRHNHRRPGSHLDQHSHEVEQQLLPDIIQLRMGTDEEPGRCVPVETEGRRRRQYRTGSARPVKASHAKYADHRPCLAVRPRLRKDLEALL